MTIGDENQSDFGFDIREGRAMVSLGPLSEKKYCTYSCAFCYVNAEFDSYPSHSTTQIKQVLRAKLNLFDVVYVSGDTDSLAHPRTSEGIELIEALVELGTDVLFTTRAPLTDEHLDRLASINEKLTSQGNILFGCISIPRLRSAPHLEPIPIPLPEERLRILEGLHTRGIVSVLAIRPFLPIVPVEEYIELARIAAPFVDVILGEVWYADKGGILEEKVFNGVEEKLSDYQEHQMDFDDNDAMWKVWEAKEVRKAVGQFCADTGVPFFMRSRPAILHVRETRKMGSKVTS